MTGTGQSAEARWFKSHRSGGGDCVEVAFVGDDVWVRDSKDPYGPVLTFCQQSWRAFLTELPDIPPSTT
ncbi:DUF397 domain-containing protein [Actinoplanes sp. NPDC026619]|uniref:DUF397 domain-containing protein n=1 Tax=Actinoplanes sp. NPDC026619 TaxID=3155798 RepID=UPI0033F1F05B